VAQLQRANGGFLRLRTHEERDWDAEGRIEPRLPDRTVRRKRCELAQEMVQLMAQDMGPSAPHTYARTLRQADELLRRLSTLIAEGNTW
jgi:hypothetical protein